MIVICLAWGSTSIHRTRKWTMAFFSFFLINAIFFWDLVHYPQKLFSYWLHNLHIWRLPFQPWGDTTQVRLGSLMPHATKCLWCQVPHARRKKGHRISPWKESCSDYPLQKTCSPSNTPPNFKWFFSWIRNLHFCQCCIFYVTNLPR